MRNLLAFFAAALIVFAGLGYYLDWYKIDRVPTATGHQQLNIDIRETTPEEFGRFVQDQMTLWTKVVKEANIRLG